MSGFQVMPPLAPDERVELEASIRAHGVQVPISVSSDGVIVDGHHRDEIARRHGLHCPRVIVDGDAAKLRGLAFSLNLHRRHLTREQKRAVVAKSIKADPQLSDREHGRRTGVSGNTAAAVRRDLESTAQVEQSNERVSGDGRVRPATQPRHEITVTDEGGTDVGGMVDDRDPGDKSDQDWIDAAYDTEAALPNQDWIDEATPDEGYDGDRGGDLVTNTSSDSPTPAAAPAQSRRRPLTDAFDSASYELRKAVERVVRLAGDDRLEKNKDQISGSNLSDLVRVRDAITGVINTLEG